MKLRVNENSSEKEIMFELLKCMLRIEEKLPDSSKPTAKDLGLIDNDNLGNALDLSRWTLAELRKSGKLRFSKIGTRIFYLISDVIEMVKENFQRE